MPEPPATSPSAVRWREAKIVGLLGAGYFCNGFYLLVLPPLFPLLKEEFGTSYAALGGVMTAFSLATSLAQTPLGFLVDRIGARFVLIAGLAVVAAGTGLLGFAPSIAALYALAVVAGVGNGVFQPTDYAILSASIAAPRLGRAYAIHGFAGYLGFVAAPAVMILLTEWWNWRAAAALAGAGGLAVAAAMVGGRDLLRRDGTAGAEGRAPAPHPAGAARSGLSLLFSPPMLLFLVFYVFITSASGAYRTFAVASLMILHEVPLAVANGFLSGYFAASAIGVLVGGVAADRSRRHEAFVAACLSLGAILFASMAAASLPLWALAAAAGGAGVTHGIIRPGRDLLIRGATPVGSIGKVFAFTSTGGNLGGAVTPVLVGWLIDLGEPRWAFWTPAALLLLAALAILWAARLAARGRTGG